MSSVFKLSFNFAFRVSLVNFKFVIEFHSMSYNQTDCCGQSRDLRFFICVLFFCTKANVR